MSDTGFHHRSALKSANKPFKGKSKGRIKRQNKGKVDDAPRQTVKQATVAAKKVDRAHQAKQRQKQKRDEVLARKRLGGRRGAPKVVGIISLTPGTDPVKLLDMICASATPVHITSPLLRTVSFNADKKDQRFTFYAAPRETSSVLDIAKVADLLVFLVAPDVENECVNSDLLGLHFVSAIKAQGLAPVLGAIQGLTSLTGKKEQRMRSLCSKFYNELFDDQPKLFDVDQATDLHQLTRWLMNIKLKEISWRETRPYSLGLACDFRANDDNPQLGTLKVTGYLRGGRPLSANQLVHITGVGDFQLDRIEGYVADEKSDKSKARSRAGSIVAGMQDDETPAPATDAKKSEASSIGRVVTLQVADAKKQETLEEMQALDTLNREQAIITEEEIAAAHSARLAAAAKGTSTSTSTVRHETSGAGMSSYQKVWDELLDDEEEDDDDDDAKQKPDGDEQMGAAAAAAAAPPPASLSPAIDEDEDDDGEMPDGDDEEGMAIAPGSSSGKGDLATGEKRKLEREDLDFPDEVETPKDQPARIRFAKYRGLKSFKHSPWDAKESLPLEYGHIFQFDNFEMVKKQVLTEHLDPEFLATGPVAPEGPLPIILHIRNVPTEAVKKLAASQTPVCVWGLHAFEHKISVLHFLVKRHTEYEQPIKGKDPMVFHCGFRRFQARPVYSQHNTNCDKNMMERFFQQGRFSVASVYGRIMFPPAPVIMTLPHKPEPSDEEDAPAPLDFEPLVASGSLLSVDPDRMIIKRIVLTGQPFSVHKKLAIIRFMFFTAEDIRWFKPVELWTKHKLHGNIKEPRGTKGNMKCVFDGLIQQHDTVCMSLYKRQFPPWDPSSFTY